ncbi:hypothetical protein Ssi03_19280 [Sphaerisporangium siamense]|nr:hypothetical protein Ssi03_19280 [Sphaerisporangium siamense]
MDEDVSAAVVGRDEAEALLGVEPLDGSLSHGLILLIETIYEARGCGSSGCPATDRPSKARWLRMVERPL